MRWTLAAVLMVGCAPTRHTQTADADAVHYLAYGWPEVSSDGWTVLDSERLCHEADDCEIRIHATHEDVGRVKIAVTPEGYMAAGWVLRPNGWSLVFD